MTILLPPARPRLSLLKVLREVAAVGTIDPEHAARQVELYDMFEHWNAAVFSNRLQPVHVNLAITPYGHKLGVAHGAPVQYIEIHPICWAGAADHHATWAGTGVSGTVLHEMIHLACYQSGQDPEHKGRPWAAWCDHIGQILGIPLTYVQHSRRKDSERNNVWVPTVPSEPRPGTRLASYHEIYSFPSMFNEGAAPEDLPKL